MTDWSQRSMHSIGPLNPGWMSIPTRVKRVGRGFVANGRPIELGEVVVVNRYDAEGLVKLGKAIIV